MSSTKQIAWPSKRFESVSDCLLCGCDECAPALDGVQDWFFAAVPGEFAFLECAQCRSLVLAERPLPEFLPLAYRAYYTHEAGAQETCEHGIRQRLGRSLARAYARKRFANSTSITDQLASRIFTQFMVRRAEVDAQYRHLPASPADVLDYGCGNGDFLLRASRLGHRAVGVDFDEKALAAARKSGLEVFSPDSTGPFEGRFDLITLAHVLEHVADPVALLAQCRGWLKPGGSIFIEVPNSLAEGLARFGRFWRGLEAPRHFSIPSREGLRSACSSAGLQVTREGMRAFAAAPLDQLSQQAARANGDATALWAPVEGRNGPAFITCLAQAKLP